MKKGDVVLVSACATGVGKSKKATIDKIEKFMGQTLITVSYLNPDEISGLGGCYVKSQVKKI